MTNQNTQNLKQHCHHNQKIQPIKLTGANHQKIYGIYIYFARLFDRMDEKSIEKWITVEKNGDQKNANLITKKV